MLEQIILGTIQGIAEWLPVSSEGILVLIKTNFFAEQGLEEAIKQILFLHLGTFLAALVYFRKDVLSLIKTLFNYKSANLETKKILSQLGSIPKIIKGDIFKAKPRKNIPKRLKPTPAMKKARKRNIRKAQAARRGKR